LPPLYSTKWIALPDSLTNFHIRNKIRKEQTLSNSPSNREQSQKIDLTPTQQNPGAARAEDFKIEARDGGQHGDSTAERAALLAEREIDAKPSPPDRNEVPHKRLLQ
jgi:hypothetical protein